MHDTDAPADEISLLDIAVVIAENWLMLVIGPLIVGALVYFGMSVATPRAYQSEALLRIDATEAAMLRSARVLNPAILGSSYLEGYSGSLSRARNELVDNALVVTPEPNTELYRVRVTQETPDGAHELLTSIIDALIANSVPSGAQRAQLELEQEQAQAAIAELEGTLARLNRTAETAGGPPSGDARTEFGESVVTLVSEIEQRRMRLFRIEQSLAGTVSEEDIVQPPTLPDSPEPQGLAMRAILAVLATGFVLLIVAFLRASLHSAGENPRHLEKVNRIRRAFWLKPKELPAIDR